MLQYYICQLLNSYNFLGVKWGQDKFHVKCSILFTTLLGLDNNLKIFNECDENSVEKNATDINQAMVIVTIFRGEDPSKIHTAGN